MPRFMVTMTKLNKLALITGADITFENQFLIHSPTLKELGEKNISEEDLFKTLRLITISKNQIDYEINAEISNFQLLLGILLNPQFPKEDRNIFFKILEILLQNYNLSLSDIGIVLNDKNQEKFYIINQDNFDTFQQYIKEIFCLDKIFPQENEYNVKSAKAKRIAEQLKERHKILAEKNAENNGNIIGSYLSILSVGMSIPIENVANSTVFQLFYMLDRYTLYYSYDLDVRCKLAGGSGDSKPENWMKIM